MDLYLGFFMYYIVFQEQRNFLISSYAFLNRKGLFPFLFWKFNSAFTITCTNSKFPLSTAK